MFWNCESGFPLEIVRMTIEDFKAVGRRNLLVGIKFDGHTKELLDWALVKVADSGDKVVAIHVCRNSDSTSKEKHLLDGFLDDYDGLCNEKQLDLTCHVLRGNSIRKALVREAKNQGAIAVIVGISKHRHLGGWTSIAKYCSRRLPTTTEVLAIHNGKIVFCRSSNIAGSKGDPKPSFYSFRNSTFKDYHSEFGDSEITEFGKCNHEVIPSSEDKSKDGNGDSRNDSICPAERAMSSSLSSISSYVEDLVQNAPGWPLLRTANPSKVSPEARDMSVVQWVMSLPDRSSEVTSPSDTSPTSNKTEIGGDDCNLAEDRDRSNGELAENLKLLLKANSSSCKWFNFDELKNSTSQFSLDNLIGKGGCNRVYRGLLRDGRLVAVKIMKSSKEAQENFLQEVNIMTTVKHTHIAPLLGICIKDDDILSVYNYFSKGNLEENLHGLNKEKIVLSWDVRFSVAVGIAEALNYLHGECPRPIIHRDIKSSNILLSNDYTPQLTDFGLATWGTTTSFFLTDSEVVGTFGYLAPEYFMYGKVSDKIDVYSFGVVLLELLSGRNPIGSENPKGQESLVMWAKPKLESGDIKGILDPSLDKNINEPQVHRLALAAMLCITRSARLRSKMSEILEILRGEKDAYRGVETQLRDHKNLEKQDYDDEVYPDSSMESHLCLAFLDVDDSSTSFSSVEPRSATSLEAYLKGRWSRSSSLD